MRSNTRNELYEHPHWFAFRTRPRAEKKVDRLLAGRGEEAYLPLLERERQWSDRTKRVELPLFPGYLFIRIRLTRLSETLATPGLFSVVSLSGHPTPVREEELESVRALVEGANRTGIEPHPSDYLAPGDPVRVTEGPFQGLRGTLVEERGGWRVLVRIPALRQAVGVELDRRWLRAVEEAA